MTPPVAALPFIIKRSTDAWTLSEYTSTTVTAHGLLRVEDDRLVIQWRVSRTTDRHGMGYTTEQEHEEVKETSVPLRQLASAQMRHTWRLLGRSPRLVLNASDLRAFEGVAGPTGLALAHPSRLELQLQRGDSQAGREFAAELELAISEHQLRLAESSASTRLPPAAD
jgi:hypothetical protein